MIANIFKDGEQINRIIASEDFAQTYCTENGYTYTMEEEPEMPEEPAHVEEPEPTSGIDWTQIANAIVEGVNKV